MSDLVGNHIVGFPTRRLIFCLFIVEFIASGRRIKFKQPDDAAYCTQGVKLMLNVSLRHNKG